MTRAGVCTEAARALASSATASWSSAQRNHFSYSPRTRAQLRPRRTIVARSAHALRTSTSPVRSDNRAAHTAERAVHTRERVIHTTKEPVHTRDRVIHATRSPFQIDLEALRHCPDVLRASSGRVFVARKCDHAIALRNCPSWTLGARMDEVRAAGRCVYGDDPRAVSPVVCSSVARSSMACSSCPRTPPLRHPTDPPRTTAVPAEK